MKTFKCIESHGRERYVIPVASTSQVGHRLAVALHEGRTLEVKVTERGEQERNLTARESEEILTHATLHARILRREVERRLAA